MTLKSLIVHLDSPEQSKARLQLALDLAARQGARVIGLYVRPEPVIPVVVMGHMPAEVIEEQEAALDAHAKAALQSFEAAAAERGVASESRIERAFVEEMPDRIAQHARSADLLVMGQDNPDDPGYGGEGLIDRTVLLSGGPCLVVPYVGAPADFGKKIMLAWNGSREAARALKDALVWMTAADEVLVLSIDPQKDTSGSHEEPGQEAVRYLEEHGIGATSQQVVTDGKISSAEMLLSCLADSGSDLLVMGAYGHARMRELILGGATRTLLRHMTVPVLMSH